MSRLKSCFGDMGFQHISTYINSGNVIFSSEKDDFSNIEKILSETFGFQMHVVIRSAENIVNLASKIPKKWTNDEAQKTDILFLWDEYDSSSSLHLIEQNPLVDRLIYIDSAIVWNIYRAEANESKMDDFIGTKLYKNMTARNVNTMRKFRELLG